MLKRRVTFRINKEHEEFLKKYENQGEILRLALQTLMDLEKSAKQLERKKL